MSKLDPLAPEGWGDEECLVCHEVIRVPHWERMSMNAPLEDMLKKPPWKKRSDYEKKRKVTLSVSTWLGIGIGAVHYYVKLEERDNSIISMGIRFDEKELYEFTHPRNDKLRRKLAGRYIQDRVEVKGEALSPYSGYSEAGKKGLADGASKALELGLELFKKEFGCETHFLVSDKQLEAKRGKALKELRRRLRGDGD